jgi:hypothetical protein
MSPAQANPASFLAAPLPTVDLSNEPTRQRLTPAAIEAMVRLADIWRLTSVQASQLLGDVSERTWFRMKKREWDGTLSQDVLTRISAMIGIFKGLHLLFSDPLADEWVSLPNSGPAFGGQRPIDSMIAGGIPAMLLTRNHIDALRGGL